MDSIPEFVAFATGKAVSNYSEITLRWGQIARGSLSGNREKVSNYSEITLRWGPTI